ncbi:hypothetical protein ES705_26746 [subsurface metagenome]
MFYSCEYEQREPFDAGNLPEVVSFNEHLIPIFENKCVSCHPISPPDLTRENAFFDLTNGNYLNIENPESSFLYEKISGSGSMAKYADDYDRAIILKWIEQGAEDN